ncbi:MAG: glycosyltransferase family 2 protein [Magnetococcales bacterium]|nr:glycosyltransferase family 2 protein [Magnetococcales bacterium]
MADKKSLIIIPAYNEEKAIGGVVAKACALGFHVVVVDDCSRDQTGRVAREAGAVVLRHPTNLGYGSGLQTGYRYALLNGYPDVVQLDGDGQHDPQGALDLLRTLRTGECDLVLGSRFLHSESYRVSGLRRLGQNYFIMLLRMFTGWRLTDPTSGFQAMTADVMRFYCTPIYPNDFPDANILMLLHRQGFRVREVPVRMHASQTGSMHSGLLRPAYYMIRMTLSFFIAMLLKLPTEHRK